MDYNDNENDRDNEPEKKTRNRRPLELTVALTYVSWGVWEAIRELLQNAKDADAHGHASTVKYYDRPGTWKNSDGKVTQVPSNTLVINNQGVTIGRESLILGGTTKRGDASQIGQWGEGMKLAWAALVRLGLEVWLRSAEERWAPCMMRSENFNGAELLGVVTHKIQWVDEVHVEVRGLSPEDWATIQTRCLWLQSPEHSIDVPGEGQILQDACYKGQVFCKGLYICNNAELQQGYNFNRLDIDRDRNMADPWSLKWRVSQMIEKADLDASALLNLLSDDTSGEARAITDNAAYGEGAVSAKILQLFEDKHGQNALPCSTTAETIEAEHHGFKAVVVPAAVKRLIEVKVGTSEKRKDERKLQPKVEYAWSELTEPERKIYQWTETLVASALQRPLPPLSVVDYYNDKVMGTYDGGQIKIARRCFSDRMTVLKVYLHELAHHVGGGDGTVDHRDHEASLWAACVAYLLTIIE